MQLLHFPFLLDGELGKIRLTHELIIQVLVDVV